MTRSLHEVVRDVSYKYTGINSFVFHYQLYRSYLIWIELNESYFGPWQENGNKCFQHWIIMRCRYWFFPSNIMFMKQSQNISNIWPPFPAKVVCGTFNAVCVFCLLFAQQKIEKNEELSCWLPVARIVVVPW